jgi:hypothetical protein
MLRNLWPKISWVPSIRTIPEGADVYVKNYSATNRAWEYLGRSPIDHIKIPLGSLRWQIKKDGFQTLETVSEKVPWPSENSRTLNFKLYTNEHIPTGMVQVGGRSLSLDTEDVGHLGPVEIKDYLIDRFEVTNKSYKAFVDRGGYRKQEY